MKERPRSTTLADGRFALLHGPIHCLCTLEGSAGAVEAAKAAMATRFATILDELCAERPALADPDGVPVCETGQRMAAAIAPYRRDRLFVTPMAAVAGAVADTVLAAALSSRPLSRLIVNNGGDIALHLSPGTEAVAGAATPAGQRVGAITLTPGDSVGGVATSGAGGRSHSCGIADAVTVLAHNAAAADAAATLIANAVDIEGHPAITRRPACALSPDSDLGTRAVVTDVGPLSASDVQRALSSGASFAQSLVDGGVIKAALLALRGAVLTVPAGRFTPITRRPSDRSG